MESREVVAVPVTVTRCHCGAELVLVLTVAADQLATRELSCDGSISCSDGPVPSAATGQGSASEYVTSSITMSSAAVGPGSINLNVSPLFLSCPANSPASRRALP